MNKYMIFTGICYALSTPLGVHIGYLMGQDNWTMVFIELAVLIVIHILAPIMWVKAQTQDLKENAPPQRGTAPRSKDDDSRGTAPQSKDDDSRGTAPQSKDDDSRGTAPQSKDDDSRGTAPPIQK